MSILWIVLNNKLIWLIWLSCHHSSSFCSKTCRLSDRVDMIWINIWRRHTSTLLIKTNFIILSFIHIWLVWLSVLLNIWMCLCINIHLLPVSLVNVARIAILLMFINISEIIIFKIITIITIFIHLHLTTILSTYIPTLILCWLLLSQLTGIVIHIYIYLFWIIRHNSLNNSYFFNTIYQIHMDWIL